MMTTYVTFIEENFNTGEPDADQHDFVSIRPVPKGEMELFSEDNRFWIEGTVLSKLKNLRKLIKNYDYVLWYSFIVPHRYALFLSIHPLIRKKIFLGCMGHGFAQLGTSEHLAEKSN